MSSKNRKNKNSNRQQANPSPAKTAPSGPTGNQGGSKKEEPAQEIEKLSAAATANVTESDLKALDDKPPASPDASVMDLITKGNEALSLLIVQRERAKKEEETARSKQAELEKERNSLESDRKMAQRQLAEAEEKAGEVEQREKALLEREESLLKRELDADAGFAQRNRQALGVEALTTIRPIPEKKAANPPAMMS